VARPKDFHDLLAWQKAMLLARGVYEATNIFPKEEMFGLKSQIRRAAVSIPANVAEGHGRLTDLQFDTVLVMPEARSTNCKRDLSLPKAGASFRQRL
jgi:hypothetical protein